MEVNSAKSVSWYPYQFSNTGDDRYIVPLPTSMMPEYICDGKCFEAKYDHLSSEKACDHKAHHFVSVVDKFQKDEVTIDQVCD